MIFELVSFLILCIALFTELLLIVLWQTKFIAYESTIREYPTADILIAARNEENNIANCLASIGELAYPQDKIKVWIGDDGSTDDTWKIIKKFQLRFSHFNGIQIEEELIAGNGKANVLAQLAKKGNNEWLFITDADITVPKNWVKKMLEGGYTANADLITGTSLVEGSALLAKIQRLDWLYATSMLKLISDLGVPVSTMGNNMAVKRNVYFKVGGFEGLPFSITEDLELFKAVKKNHTTVNLCSAGVLNKSAPQESMFDLFIQRKRWMRGAFELPYQLLSILIIQAAYFPAILILIFFNPIVGLSLWGSKWVVKFVFQVVTAKKLRENVSIFDSFATEIFSMVFSMVSLVHYLWPGKIYWKGRAY
jgi:cellulose synthase/poly-beta-1,6-N-acetylglucosamine synthase-like glycosyltransferase